MRTTKLIMKLAMKFAKTEILDSQRESVRVVSPASLYVGLYWLGKIMYCTVGTEHGVCV